MFNERQPGGAALAGDLIARRLEALAPLSERELQLLRRAGERVESEPSGAELRGVRILVSGWACRRQLLADRSRQIFTFLLPGDPCDPRPDRGRSRTGIVALTPVRSVNAADLFDAAADLDRHPGLARALDAVREGQERLLLDHILRLGALTAYQRVAHLLLELRERLAAVGLADERRMPMPLTQETLADALGLSVVHVNRTLQQLRREQLIELRSGVAVLIDPAALAELCGYQDQARPRTIPAGRGGGLESLPRAAAPLR